MVNLLVFPIKNGGFRLLDISWKSENLCENGKIHGLYGKCEIDLLKNILDNDGRYPGKVPLEWTIYPGKKQTSVWKYMLKLPLGI
jgi:hypothetical protein